MTKTTRRYKNAKVCLRTMKKLANRVMRGVILSTEEL
jgi:hypothetical protein